MSDEQYLTVAEVVDILGLGTGTRKEFSPKTAGSEEPRTAGAGKATVYRWIKNGELKAISLGGVAGYRIRKSDLDAFILAREVKTEVSKLLEKRSA